MLHSLQAWLLPATAERLTLALNHVLSSETVATERLRPHAGRSIVLSFAGWPPLLPAPPALAWRVTPAGLLEWCGSDAVATPDLSLQLDASNPALLIARAVGGTAPQVQIDGDAQLAGDVNWLLHNLRWDAAADLERLFGPVVAQQMVQVGSAVGRGIRAAVKAATELGGRLRSRAP
jgi:ubiquinone biosynthesis accessory factor UbiJ